MTAPAIAHGCHHGWRTLIGIEALFSGVIHVYGSDLSKTYACRVLFPCPYRRTVNTSFTVESEGIVWSAPFGFPFLSNHSAWLETTAVTPPLIVRTSVVMLPADARPGLFVTFTVTVTRSPSAGSVGVTFNVPASRRRSAWSNGSICTLTLRVKFPVFGFAGSASRKPLSLTDRVTL